MTVYKYNKCDREGCNRRYLILPEKEGVYSYEGWLTFYRLSRVKGDVMPDGLTHYCSEACLKLALNRKRKKSV